MNNTYINMTNNAASCTSCIFAARTLDFPLKFRFVFRHETLVFRRYVLAHLLARLFRKFGAYLLYPSLIRSNSLGAFHFFKNSAILLICCYGFTLSSPVSPREVATCAIVFQLCRARHVYNVGSITDSGIRVNKCARCNGLKVAVSEQTRSMRFNRAVQDCGRRLNQSHFRPMAEVSFLLSANTRKRASASREQIALCDM